MEDEARRLRDRGAVMGKAWSLAQVCEHLAMAVRGTVDLPLADAAAVEAWWMELGPLERLKRRVMQRGLLWSRRFPEGVPSPRMVVPSEAAELESAIRLLAAAAAAFDEKLKRPGARWIYHPLLGPMNGRRWKRFHDLHARHHFGFMRDGVSR